MKLAIDIGNSRAKFAVFEGNDILFSGESSHDELRNELHNLALKHPKLNKGIVADVTKRGASLLANWEIFPLFYLNHQSKLPITINYLTPQSLGIDRIALASAGRNLFPHSNILIIDAGSCITFDFLNANHSFLGVSWITNNRWVGANNSHDLFASPTLLIKLFCVGFPSNTRNNKNMF